MITSASLTSSKDAITVADQCDTLLDLANASLANEHLYQSLPLCVIDAVFSIGVKYESVKNVVSRYCDYFGVKRLRNESFFASEAEQVSISLLVQQIEQLGIEHFTDEIFKNRCRTSTCNGILKTEAVLRFAQVLRNHGVNYLQGVAQVVGDLEFEAAIKQIPGQKSGISLDYFYMMTGSDDVIKPDRMILRFLETALRRGVTVPEARVLLVEASRVLEVQYRHMTPRLLDYVIWKYQRDMG